MQVLSSPPLICSFACINAKWLPVCFILLSKSSQRVVISNISSRLIRANSGLNSAFNYIVANWSSTADSSGSYPKRASAEWRLGSRSECWAKVLPLGTRWAAGKHGAKEGAQTSPWRWFCRKMLTWDFCKSSILQQMQFADGHPSSAIKKNLLQNQLYAAELPEPAPGKGCFCVGGSSCPWPKYCCHSRDSAHGISPCKKQPRLRLLQLWAESRGCAASSLITIVFVMGISLETLYFYFNLKLPITLRGKKKSRSC